MTDGFEFDPARLTVDAGVTVRWTNDSDVPHTVTAETDGLPARAAYFASGGFDTERAARADVRGGLVDPDHLRAVAALFCEICVHAMPL